MARATPPSSTRTATSPVEAQPATAQPATSRRTSAPKIAAAKTTKPRAPQAPFYKRLILADWLLAQLGVEAGHDADQRELSRFQTLGTPLHALEQRLKTESGENLDPAGGGTAFCPVLLSNFPNRSHLSGEQIEAYDRDIMRLWKRITKNRGGGRKLKLKYFQWLALLVNAVYLDRYFSDRDALLQDLNVHRATFNTTFAAEFGFDAAPPFERDGLNTLSFWCATGSGKTLMMHAHLLQFLEMNKRRGGKPDTLPKIDHIFLLTPDSDLSAQHIREASDSGLVAAPFAGSTQQTLSYNDWQIETLENTKIRDPKKGGKDAGPTTFDIDTLNGANLVLVDEGHLGAGGEVFMVNRRTLAQNGFCYEYSATFGQVVAANSDLGDLYARNIALDYSYRQFYRDGYGKEFRLFNLPDGSVEEARDEYLCGALLAYDAQLRAFEDGDRSELLPFGFARPLWVFVGNTVVGSDERTSDILDVLRFVHAFLDRPAHYRAVLDNLAQNKGVLCERAPDVFEGLWDDLTHDGAALYAGIVARVFGGVGTLGIAPAKDGELHLRTGDNAPFGLVHVGDAAGVVKLAKRDAALTDCVRDDKIAGDALFAHIDDDTSSVRLLIGARKFISGWNAYRVATLGLMKVGRGEGPQIIQLFGRGVRLRGRDNSLMRAARYGVNFGANAALKARVERLESLQIFGLQAEYMKTFLDNLRLDVPVEKTVSIELPVKARFYDPRPALQTLYLPGGASFEESGIRFSLGDSEVVLGKDKTLKMAHQGAVSHDEYSRLDSRDSKQLLAGAESVRSNGGENQERLSKIAPHLDLQWLQGQLHRFKEERGYHALQLPANDELAVLLHGDWHEWKVPTNLIEFNGDNYAARRRGWHQSALALLQKFIEWSYKRVKAEYERGQLRLKPFEWEADRSWETKHTFTVSLEDSSKNLRQQLETARAQLEQDAETKLDLTTTFGLRLLDASAWAHLYRPLVMGSGKCWKVTPVVLDKNEAEFLEKLCAYRKKCPAWFEEREVYVLRNKSRTGVGFFEEGGFFPDFLVWIIEGKAPHQKQTLAFVDPKGLRNVKGLKDPKVTLHKRIRDLENELGGEVHLRSFLVSNTKQADIQWAGDLSISDFEQAGVYFQDDDEHLVKLLEAATT